MSQPPPMLGVRFKEAMDYAFELHSRQLRKGSRVPYFSHLLGVTALVLEDGGDEDQAIAALLHDAVEDQGGLETLAEIRRRYGERVAAIVEGCTDTLAVSSAISGSKAPWRLRKNHYLEHLADAGEDIRRVSLADKLHNARSILADLRRDGELTWSRFNGGKEGTLWYYRELLAAFRRSGNDFMVGELGRVLADIESLASGVSPPPVDRTRIG